MFTVARLRHCDHTLLVVIKETWNHNTLPTCAKLMIYKMSSISFSTAPTLIWFLSAGLMYLCFILHAGFDNVSAFLSQDNNKLYLFLHALKAFYEQARSRTS